MLITIQDKRSDGSATTVTIDPERNLDDAASSPRASSSKQSSANTASANGTKPSANEAEQAFADRFGWPPKPAIVLEKGTENFEADKKLIKESRLYRWSKDHYGEGKGAWALKETN